VTFQAVHEQGAKTLAQESAAAGVARFVLVSGMGADPESGSSYIRARGRGERAVQQAFSGVSVVRPGAMFGPGDALFGTLADVARLLPVLPLIGGGRIGQVDLLRADNVASRALPGFRELDIQPKAIEEIVPTYLGRPPAREPD
jgi:NADH dehydrogenase